MLSEHGLLGLFERLGVLIVGGDKGVDLRAHLPRRGEADAGQGFAREDRKPNLDLVEPGGMGRDAMKMDVLVASAPTVLFGLVGVEIVEDDVPFAVRNSPPPGGS